MDIKKIQDADLKNKRVILRVDFNVEVEEGKAMGKFKISSAKETVDYILSQEGAKLALISHLGRPTFTDVVSFGGGVKGKTKGTVAGKYSLKSLEKDVEEILGHKVVFVSDCIGEKVKKGLDEIGMGEILLLENIRLYPGEEINEESFAKDLAENFDVFINDAFSVCHRDQASVTGISMILPSYSGFRLQKEIENLDKVKDNPTHPAVAVIGGAKIETKLPLIQMFEKRYDTILVGGKIAVEAQSCGLSFASNVMLPVDYAENKMDIGNQTIDKFRKSISVAKTIVWNGPMGKFEEPPYDKGTSEILNAIVASKAFTVIGGGESVQALEEQNLLDKVSFVSTGGGAMLEYLSGNILPGISSLMV